MADTVFFKQGEWHSISSKKGIQLLNVSFDVHISAQSRVHISVSWGIRLRKCHILSKMWNIHNAILTSLQMNIHAHKFMVLFKWIRYSFILFFLFWNSLINGCFTQFLLSLPFLYVLFRMTNQSCYISCNGMLCLALQGYVKLHLNHLLRLFTVT